jgi:hypothetical protein
MSKSDIVFQLQYKTPKNKKVGISNWIKYASQKQKADSASIDEYNLLKDYALYSTKDSYLTENDETFLWNSKGDLLKKDAINNLKGMDGKGIFWRGFLSFPPEFAMDHGLITKMDFSSLTNNVIPSLIVDMGLDINNVEWMCALHRDTKHPHIHFCIYEKNQTKTSPLYSKSVIYNFKSNVANYLIDNKKFYDLRDQTYTNITGTISLKELNKLKSQRLFSDSYRKGLNKLLLNFYNELPKNGRLQYNSKNMIPYKKDLNNIIEYILLHDSVKYDYANYLKLLETHQKELNQLYGSSNSNKERKYYNEQLNRLYSKIGNEILKNYKIYQSLDFLNREKNFLQKHINELNFRSRNDYAKDETKKDIAKNLYKICMLSGLNDSQTKKVFSRWIKNSHYDYDVDSLVVSVTSLDSDMSVQEFYDILKKLGYDSDRYNKFKNKYFYRELNYKRFINQAVNHLMYELEQEEKQIVGEMQYELEDDYIK